MVKTINKISLEGILEGKWGVAKNSHYLEEEYLAYSRFFCKMNSLYTVFQVSHILFACGPLFHSQRTFVFKWMFSG